MGDVKVYRQRMNLGRRDILWLCALIAVAVLLSFFLRAQSPMGQDVADNPLALAVRNDRTAPVEDNLSADLTLIVFTDYRCPACRGAHPGMKRAIARDGKVRVVYKDWPIFGPASERAAEVALASDLQNIYPSVHDQLMTGPANTDISLRHAVGLAGGDWQRLIADLNRNKVRIAEQVEQTKLQAFQLGLNGTPGYLIGPLLVRGALSEREFTQAFKQARKGQISAGP